MSSEYDVFDAVLDGETNKQSDVLVLSKEQLKRDETQPRTKFSKTELESLADSMDEQGQLEDIKIYPDPDENGVYTIFNGERRWRSLDITKNITELRARKVDLSKIEHSQVTQYHYNNFAEKNDVVEVAAICNSLKEQGKSNKQIAKIMSISTGEASRLAKIHSMPDEIRELYLDDLVNDSRKLYLLCQCFEINSTETVQLLIDLIKKEGGTSVKKIETFKDMISGKVNNTDENSDTLNEGDSGNTDLHKEPEKEQYSTPVIEQNEELDEELDDSLDNDYTNSTPSSEKERDVKDDGNVEISNVRIKVAKQEGYLITVKRSSAEKAFVFLDDEEDEREVLLSDIKIIAIV